MHYFEVPKLRSIHSSTLDTKWWLGVFQSILLTLSTYKDAILVFRAWMHYFGVPKLRRIHSTLVDPKWCSGARGPEGVPKHDRVTLLDGDEARHPVLSVSVLSFSSVSKDFASASGEANFQVLASHPQLRLWYSASSSLVFHGFSDADFAWCRLDRKSTSGTCQFLGSSLVSWSSRKQSCVAQSTTEAEYVAAASCCSQLLWITYTMSEEYTLVPLQCDSTSAKRCKEVSASFQNQAHRSEVSFSERKLEKGRITLMHVPTHDHMVDICTKPLDQATFTHLRGDLVVCLVSWVVVWEILCTYV
jgi:hypothetical protein